MNANRGNSRGRGRADTASTSSRSTGQGGPGRGRGRGSSRGCTCCGSVIYREEVPAQLPPQLEPQVLQQLVNRFKSMEISSPAKRPLRPGYGTLGQEIKLRTNFFAVKLPKQPIFDYVIAINPTDLWRMKRHRIIELLEKSPHMQPHLSYIAHDHRQRLVSAKKLPQPLEVPLQFYDDHENGPSPNAKVYSVSITFGRELNHSELTKYTEGQPEYRDYNLLPLISALNLVLQQHASRTGVRFGKNRYSFNPSMGTRSLGPCVDAVQGFHSSIRPGFKQLLVNVNVCVTAFVSKGNLADKLKVFSLSSWGAMPTLPKGLIKSIRVRALHLGYSRKLLAIGTRSASNEKFNCAECGGEISVEQYFLKKYKKQLVHPHDLPVVNIGTYDKPNWVPAELCEIEDGNIYRDKLNDKETAEMIRYACNPPRVNAESIVENGLTSLALNPPTEPITGFGIAVDKELLVIPARQLQAPRLTYKSGLQRVQNASWNIVNVKFHRGANVDSWWVLVVRDGKRIIESPTDTKFRGLVEAFRNKMSASGMTVPSGMPQLLEPANLVNPREDLDRRRSLTIIRNALKAGLEKSRGRKPSFVLVLLESRDHYIYPGIKRIGDVELGIHTVHMQVEKATKPGKQDQYLSNVVLKVNTKLGGLNHLLEESTMQWLEKNSMMVGIDVTHPGPGARDGCPSIAAVVASTDDQFVQFPASLRIQTSRNEILDELHEMMIERLRAYEQRNKMLPERIFVFRNGVSGGQFHRVLEEELPQILEAFKKLSGKQEYRPKLSIINCGKRHHAKFWPTTSPNADRNGNTLPGTVVDKGITSVFDFDFYLQAHAGIQGHVKATHYTVLYDENSLSADDIQQATYVTSYLYARATKAVSLIPAAYYADLACERGKCYLNDFLVDGVVGGEMGQEEERKSVYDAARKLWGGGLHSDIRGSMFYI